MEGGAEFMGVYLRESEVGAMRKIASGAVHLKYLNNDAGGFRIEGSDRGAPLSLVSKMLAEHVYTGTPRERTFRLTDKGHQIFSLIGGAEK